MINKFDAYPEISDSDAKSKVESENQSENSTICSEDIIKMKKKIKKHEKEQKKMRKKIRKINKKLLSNDRFNESEKDEGKKNKTDKSKGAEPKKEKSFWGRLGDTILKAVPSILITAATTIATLLIGQTPKPHGKLGKAVV